jgi:hypothetical protein
MKKLRDQHGIYYNFADGFNQFCYIRSAGMKKDIKTIAIGNWKNKHVILLNRKLGFRIALKLLLFALFGIGGK